LSQPTDPAFEHIHEPGGFRRNYVLLQANEQGAEPQILNNFIDFLLLFGHFVSSLILLFEIQCPLVCRLVKTWKRMKKMKTRRKMKKG
jgi:hypothetical protein